jgi:predicted DNA-binding transcriptional regulator AlpA
MDDITVVDCKDLRALGIKYSRTQLWRLMRAGKFPQCFKLADDPKSRIVWWLNEIRAYLLHRASHR